MPAVLLADDMGLGKTVQAIAAIQRLNAAGEARRVLVVAPAGLLAHWRNELRRFAPDLTAIRVVGSPSDRAWQWRTDHVVHIAGYETVRNDQHAARAALWDIVVLDEAQKIKNRDAAVSRACKQLPRRRSWALTGTPLENRVDELASILEFVRPNPEGTRLPSLTAGLSLTMRHHELQLRRRKKDVLTELPPRLDVRLPVELTTSQRAVYQRVLTTGRAELIDLGERATVVNVFEVLTRLKQVCNFEPDSGESSKLADVSERMDELASVGHRALVFSQFVSGKYGVERIANGLDRFRPLTYTGGLGLEERQRTLEQFVGDARHKALVLSLRAGGQGLNLQEASYVFHFDRWWNPAVENQASDRAHRMGQKNAVTVYAYTTLDTIEERIEQILDEKRALFAALVDGVSLDPTRHLSPDEVFGLLDLKAPERLRKASRKEPTPADVISDLLERNGWDVERLERPSSNDPLARAARVDELGSPIELWVFHVAQDRTGGLVTEVARRLDPEQRALIVADDPLQDDDLAELENVRLVSSAEVLNMADASPGSS